MAIVNKFQGDKQTFGEIADALLSLGLTERHDSRRIDVVFYCNPDISIKNAERCPRASGEIIVYRQFLLRLELHNGEVSCAVQTTQQSS